MGVDKENWKDGQQSSKINIYEGNGKTCMVMTKCVTLINYYIYSIMDVFCVKWLQKRTVVEIVYHSDLYDPQYITCMPFKSISYRPLQIG